MSASIPGNDGGCGCQADGPDVICRCEGDDCPRTVGSPPGMDRIAYRVGDFASFRRAMLRHPDGETELDGWRPTADTDLALQVVDWWAYVAEVLAFYNEQIANESYLGTAILPESVSRLISVLGYRPRPGIGATATLGVQANGPGPAVLPAGFAVLSKASPGIAPQTFELGPGTTFTEPSSVPGPPPDATAPQPAGGPPATSAPGTADPPAHQQLIVRGGVLVKGKPSAVKIGDRLLLVPKKYTSADTNAAMVTVTGLVTETDAYRKANTRVLLSGASGIPSSAQAADYRLCRATGANHLISVPSGATVISSTQITLDATARSLKAGDPLVVETPGAGVGLRSGSGFDIVRLGGYAEVLWYANAAASTPTTSPGDNGIPLLVAQLTVASAGGSDLGIRYGSQVANVTVRSGWTDVGTLLDTPVTVVSGLPSTVTLSRAPAAQAGVAVPALVEDAHGRGAAVTATPASGTNQVGLAASGTGTIPDMQPPLRLLWDLITVTRGATVADEALGVGDATLPGQDFTLAKAPVTYLADTAGGAAPAGTGGVAGAGSRSGTGYSSTVDLVVDGVHWTEVPMLYGHGPTERIFVTREDELGKTHVVTGDGVTGLRLTTGAVVTATYRTGSGAASPPAGMLTQIPRPAFNVASLRDPAGAGGGADPDPPDRIRALAPASVLTFGRAISGDDYQIVAAQAPGVTRAGAVWAWDAGQQRAMTVVYVGDDDAAVASARAALTAEADPNRPVVVRRAVPVVARLRLILRLDPAYVPDAVVAAVRSALLDTPRGLFAPGVLAVGEPLYRSRIESVCALPGVLAIHHLRLRWHGYRAGTVPRDARGPRYVPGEGGYFDLSSDRLTVTSEADADD